MDKLSVLEQYFGHKQFRDGQEGIIDAILSGQDSLGIMPTGAGKSICYQVPALMFEGITIVVSPLISLMKDQVNALIHCGVRAAYLNSSLTPEQYTKALSLARRGAFRLIYCAPERLLTPAFLHFAQNSDISMVTIDEAHCVSQWGQDFRPSYLRIAEFISSLPRRPVVSAFTATATKRVREDIINMLSLRSPYLEVTGFDRKNLYFGVMHPDDKFHSLCEILQRNEDKSGIVYCLARKGVEEVCARLCEKGFSATRYHAGLDDEERRINQDDFIYDRKKIMVATNAFGMGIDKSNVSFVVHYNMPKDIESYYQEAGRCGRDGSNGECIILYSGQDVRTNRFLIEHSDENDTLDENERELIVKGQTERLMMMTRYCTTTSCLRGFMLDYFGDRSPRLCNKDGVCGCSNCTGDFVDKDITIDAQKILSCVYRLAERRLSFGEVVVSSILKGGNDPIINTFKLDTLSTYGIMKDSTAVYIKQVIRFLEGEGYLSRDEFHTLVLTQKARSILIDRISVTMKVPRKGTSSNKKSGVRPASSNNSAERSARPELFWRLRSLRNQKAQEEKMPAYIIFSDSSLRDMCAKLPQNVQEFLNVSGVGEAKCQKYGEDFTRLIREYMAEKGISAETVQ